jgi:hypothetical protein
MQGTATHEPLRRKDRPVCNPVTLERFECIVATRGEKPALIADEWRKEKFVKSVAHSNGRERKRRANSCTNRDYGTTAVAYAVT